MPKCKDCGKYVTAFQATYSQARVDQSSLHRPRRIKSAPHILRFPVEPRCENCLDRWSISTGLLNFAPKVTSLSA